MTEHAADFLASTFVFALAVITHVYLHVPLDLIILALLIASTNHHER